MGHCYMYIIVSLQLDCDTCTSRNAYVRRLPQFRTTCAMHMYRVNTHLIKMESRLHLSHVHVCHSLTNNRVRVKVRVWVIY